MELDVLSCVLSLFAFVLSVAYVLTRRRRAGGKRGDRSAAPRRQLTFRKREKIIFYGRRLIRKVSESRKQRLATDIAKKLLKLKKGRIRDPSQSLLEVDLPGIDSTEQTLPAEIMYMLRNVRVLGHFEEPIFLEICRFIESRSIPASAFLFRNGDPNDSIYVVQAGKIRLYITEPDGTHSCVKEVSEGESIHSLLSILDVLTGCQATYNAAFAIADENSTVLRLPMKTLRIVLDRYPESLVRVVQIISLRLQRVTFLALHNYLGLCQELFSQSGVTSTSCAAGAWSSGESKESVESRKTGFSRNRSTVEDESPGSDEPDVDLFGDRPCSKISNLHNALARSNNSLTLETKPKEDTSHSDLRSSSDKASFHETTSEDISRCEQNGASLPSQQVERSAVLDLAVLLGIDDSTVLSGLHHIRNCSSGETLIREGEHEDSLYFVISGRLKARQRLIGNSDELKTLYSICPGELVGALAILTGEPSLFTVEAEEDSCVLGVEKKDFYEILKKEPRIILNMGQIVLRKMSPFVRQIDFALDWVFIEAGRALYRQKDRSDSVYIVLNGRLRSIYQLSSGKKELAGEYGRGEVVGLVEVLTHTDRSVTMMAVRDTELAQIPDGLLHLIKRQHPQIVTSLINLLGQRILGHLVKEPNLFSMISKNTLPEPRPLVAKFSTVAVLPASDRVPLTNFTRELQRALDLIGPTLCLSHDTVQARLGTSAFAGVNAYRLSSWLSQQEDLHRMVLYQCDPTLTSWTHRCIRQADCVLVVTIADLDNSVGELESQLKMLSSRAQKELVLLHREISPGPRDTVDWLGQRDWITAHYHIRCSADVFNRKGKRSRPKPVSRTSDFSRLARILTGTAVGVVLGGGAARGCAHVGILKAMVEADIPIDMIGGTSIGSFMGALWAQETNFPRFRRKAREWSMSMSSIWSFLRDITYPVTSLLSGNQFNRKIESVLRDCNIEDLWLPYFCVTTDVTASKMRVHTQGCLWRYVRSSMSLAGYLPPLCDPVDGHLLLDGAYVNNLPADVMKSMGAQTILAVDVSSENDTQFTNYGDELSGWWLLWTKWCPWVERAKVPNMVEVQSRLAFVSCERLLEAIKTSEFCDYIRPPISRYQSLQFAKFDEISEVGHRFGKSLFEEWQRTGRMQKLFARATIDDTPEVHPTLPDSSFTNLADLLARTDDNYATRSPVGSESASDVCEPEDKLDRISVASEPIFSLWFDSSADRNKAGSEGASLCSMLGLNPEDDEYLDDLY